MKIVLQRVSHASVSVDGKPISRIGSGLLLLVGFATSDLDGLLKPMAEKILALRIFPNDQGRFDRSIREVNGELLLVSQFTLLGETNRGRRPDFANAMPGPAAKELFDKFRAIFDELDFSAVKTGQFGANMQVSLENDGPVTLILESTISSAEHSA